MKKLMVIIVLMLALSSGALALTLTDADIKYPTFSFGAYVLHVSLYTDDPAEVAYEPVPAQGTPVMLRLTSFIGQIPLKDIEAGVSELALHDASDAVCPLLTWRERDVQSVDGVPSLSETQGAFELIYLLPEGTPVGGTTLFVGKADASEHIIVQLPESGGGEGAQAETSAEPESLPAPEPTPEVTSPPESAAVLTSPESADILFEGENYHISPISIGRNEDGNTTVTVSGFGDSLKIRNGQMVVHIETAILAGGQEYGWEGLSALQGNATYSFDTDLTPEVIYVYPNGEPDNRTALNVLSPGGVQEPELTPETSSEAEEPTPTTPPASDQTAESFLDQLLSDEAENVSDPWTRAILDSGAKDATYQDGSLKFNLCAYNPGLDTLGDYKTDKAAFLAGLWKNTDAYDLKCTLPATNEGGFAASDADIKALVKTVSKAAAKSKKAFDDKRMRVALSEYLLNSETAFALCDASVEQAASLFAAQFKQTLNVSDGPHALKLSTTGANGEALLQKASQAVYQRLARQEGASMLSEDEIDRIFREELAVQTASINKKKGDTIAFTLDIDMLDNDGGEEYSDFVSAYVDAYDAQFYALTDKIYTLPEYPAQDFPKSGRIDGSKSGTKVTFKAPKDGCARYIQMRTVDTEETAVTAFIQPGQSATVRVPKGMYYILLAMGEIWYGEENLFGDDGTYSRTEDLEIKGSNYYHTITLGGIEDGNMSSYGADPSDFEE
jgi:hypothetical protein